MNLKLVFRIFAGFLVLFTLGGLVAPEAMMDSFGMEYNDAVGIMFTFTAMVQAMFAFTVWKLPDWAGDNLANVGSCCFKYLSCCYGYTTCSWRILCRTANLVHFRRLVLYL